ncbi:hypothetical protein CHARACLAT_003415 [Characodon lateralis]|uniref:Uncharacterized protein n=1 Tax=Characodon lateralis TaxID=208331 RepID=A0ABU7CK31_9TELE|nr:hypothetical protein [Characodon lateralis]
MKRRTMSSSLAVGSHVSTIIDSEPLWRIEALAFIPYVYSVCHFPVINGCKVMVAAGPREHSAVWHLFDPKTKTASGSFSFSSVQQQWTEIKHSDHCVQIKDFRLKKI